MGTGDCRNNPYGNTMKWFTGHGTKKHRAFNIYSEVPKRARQVHHNSRIQQIIQEIHGLIAIKFSKLNKVS